MKRPSSQINAGAPVDPDTVKSEMLLLFYGCKSGKAFRGIHINIHGYVKYKTQSLGVEKIKKIRK